MLQPELTMVGAQVSGSGMVNSLPLSLYNGLMHAPEHAHAGVVPPLVFQDASNLGSFDPVVTIAADATGPSVHQASRTRPFHMESELPNRSASILRVQRWQRGCYFSPHLLPQVPPWVRALQALPGMLPPKLPPVAS